MEHPRWHSVQAAGSWPHSSEPRLPSRSPAAVAAPPTPGPRGRPVTLRLGYFPNLTHATAIVGVENGHFAEARQERAGDEDLQRRPGGDRGAVLRRRSTPPTSARTRRSTRYAQSNGEAIRVVSGADRPAASPSWSSRTSPASRGPQGQEDRDAAARQHPGRRAALLAEGEGLDHHQGGRRRRPDHPAGERQTARHVRRPARSTAPGCPSPASAGWSTPAARCWSTSATCGRTASSSSPT